MEGKVYLVGAGPGDPKLITLRGVECIREAEVLVYDRLVSDALIALAKPEAEMIYCGKAAGAHSISQAEINEILVRKAGEGKIVTRLKGGDPCIFGRGGDEALALVENGIRFEFVPGVSSAHAVPAYAGIPVTKRGMTSMVTYITGHEDPEKDPGIDWPALAQLGGTLVFLMSLRNLETIAGRLLDNGLSAETPAAVISRGTTAGQATVTGLLGDIARKASDSELVSPALTVVGEVVTLREKLAWFEDSLDGELPGMVAKNA